ncbi:hypothetical protein FHR24_000386 [Wenyingzhuangia heitensis]|uniref:Lipoprotein n=1 Tax=Wenyingzhuangia heitensis TaxID=1487859 RepID=A0ABX0U558_9FLAO|nr:hypothetical protein [Wenyingzhuangia heitensis]NIJ43947.1 hypothetical protein [Wenyingzhuangia heitensis]
MKHLLIVSLLFYSLVSCSNDQELPNFHHEYISVDELIIPDSLNYNEQYDITLKYTLPNSCYYYNNLYYVANKENDSIKTMAIVAYVDEDSNCNQATIEEEQVYKITANQKEDYIFKLYKGVNDDNESIYEEKIVRVIEEGEVE